MQRTGSWADSIKMISERHPEVSTTILRAVDEQHASPSFMVVSSVQSLEEAGFVPPSWEQLASGAVEVPDVFDPDEPAQEGVAGTAARAVETHFWEGLMPTISRDASLLRSQGGPLASVPLTIFPTDRTCRFDVQLFRILLLRRLRFPLPLTTRWCVCGHHLNNLGHHRAACSVAGILGRRGFQLETAAARICREAGARVRTNVFVRDLDLGVVGVLDGRRLEVVADGLPLFNGAQLAIHTILVSPIHRDGTPRPRTHHVHGVALQHARRNKEATYPELVGRGGRARLVVLAGEVGGRFSAETAQFISSFEDSGHVRPAATLASTVWTRRWSALLSCAAARAFASSLLDGRASGGVDGETPHVQEVLAAARHLG